MFTIKGYKKDTAGDACKCIAIYDDKKRMIRKIEKPIDSFVEKMNRVAVTHESLLNACKYCTYGALKAISANNESETLNTFSYFHKLMYECMNEIGDGYDLALNAYSLACEKYFENQITLSVNSENEFYHVLFSDVINWSVTKMNNSNYKITEVIQTMSGSVLDLVRYACDKCVNETRKPHGYSAVYIDMYDESESMETMPKAIRKALHFDDTTKEYDVYESVNILDSLDRMPAVYRETMQVYLESFRYDDCTTMSGIAQKLGISRNMLYKRIAKVKEYLRETLGNEYIWRKNKNYDDDENELNIAIETLQYATRKQSKHANVNTLKMYNDNDYIYVNTWVRD